MATRYPVHHINFFIAYSYERYRAGFFLSFTEVLISSGSNRMHLSNWTKGSTPRRTQV